MRVYKKHIIMNKKQNKILKNENILYVHKI